MSEDWFLKIYPSLMDSPIPRPEILGSLIINISSGFLDFLLDLRHLKGVGRLVLEIRPITEGTKQLTVREFKELQYFVRFLILPSRFEA